MVVQGQSGAANGVSYCGLYERLQRIPSHYKGRAWACKGDVREEGTAEGAPAVVGWMEVSKVPREEWKSDGERVEPQGIHPM